MKWKDIEIHCVVVWNIVIIHVELERISPTRFCHIRLQLEKAEIWGDVRDSEQNESLNITFGKKIPRRFAFVCFVRICVL